MTSLPFVDRDPRANLRIVALAAAVAVNAAALLTLALPTRPDHLLMPALALEFTAVLIDPPKAMPPPPLPEPLPLPARPEPRPVPVVAMPQPAVVAATVVESSVPAPITPPLPTAVPRPGDDGTAVAAGHGNGVMQTLAYASRSELRYPVASMRANEQGEVLLRVLVNAAGKPQRIDVAHSSGYPKLDRAARESVQHWTFRPVLQNGVATPAWGLVPVSFHLDRG